MSLKKHNNPLGQRKVSDTVGGGIKNLEHGQSADLVDEVRRKADKIHKAPKTAKRALYTQDNEEEYPKD